jgi:hypothetical protein
MMKNINQNGKGYLIGQLLKKKCSTEDSKQNGLEIILLASAPLQTY